MSDGKSSSYQVVSAAELERRALAAALDRLTRARERAAAARAALQAAEAVYGALGVAVGPAPAASANTSAGVTAVAEAIERSTVTLQANTDAAVAAVRSSQLLASVSSLFSSIAPAAPPAPLARSTRTAPPTQQPAPPVARDWGETAARVLAMLPADALAGETEQCQELLAELGRATDDARRDTVVAALRVAVQTARSRSTLTAQNGAIVDALHVELDGLEGRDVKAMRGHLRGLPLDRVLPTDLAAEVAACAERARHEADRAFVLRATRDALTEAGYDVGEDFVTIAGTSDGALMPLLTSDRHGVRVRERAGRLFFNIVRFDETGGRNRVQDLAAAETFCAGYGRVMAAVADRGVRVEPLVHYEPGAGSVQVTSTRSPFGPAANQAATIEDGDAERERKR